MTRWSWKQVLVISLLLSVTLVSFGDDQTVTLRFPHWFFGHGSSFADWINGAVDAFEKENPNIKVDREQVPYDQYWDKLDTAIAGGNAPDVAAFGPSNLGKYIEAGTLIPLNDLIDMADVKKNFSPLQTSDIPKAAQDGKTYALAFDSGFYLPLYRPSVFKSAGIKKFATTPEEFIDMAKKLTTSERFGFAFMNVPGNWNEQQLDISIWVVGLGGHWGNVQGKPTLNTPQMIKAVGYLKTLHDLKVTPRDTDKGTYRKMFGTGKVATLIDGMWMYGLSVGWDATAENDFDTAPLPFPTQHVAAFYECNGILKDSQHPKEAAKLISYLSNDAQMKRLVQITQLIPPRTSVFTAQLKAELVKKWPWYKQYIDHATQSVLMAPAAMSGTMQNQVLKILGTYFDRVLFENMDVTQALNAAQKEAEALQ